MCAGLFTLFALLTRDTKWKINEEEADALAVPAERILHGRKKVQAVIEKYTDPGLLAGAFGTIIESRLRARPSPGGATPRASAATPVAAASGMAAAAAHVAAAAPASMGAVAAPTNTLNPQDIDLSNIKVTPQAAQEALDDMFQTIVSRG